MDLKRLLAPLIQPVSYLDRWQNRLFFVLFCGLFTSAFVFIFNPFNMQSWQYSEGIGKHVHIFLTGLVAIPVLALSQLGIRAIVSISQTRLFHLFCFYLFEWLLLSSLFFLLYGEYNENGPFREWLVVARHTFLLSILPYGLGLLLLSVQENKDHSTEERINFKDENDKMVLSLKITQLQFLKSEDNYTAVHYLKSGKAQKTLIRTNLKKLSGEINHPQIMRIHRSYMVNLDQVVTVQPHRKGFQISMSGGLDLSIPVSEKYATEFARKIQFNP